MTYVGNANGGGSLGGGHDDKGVSWNSIKQS